MIKSQITFKQLEAFVHVVDTGAFRKAAEVLGTTQPNISARVAALEQTLDVILMHRDAGSVRLTDRGRALLPAARRVLLSAEAFLEEAGRRDLIHDRMRLGVTELVACTWLHDFLRAFRAEYPAIRVELDVNLSRQIGQDLAAGQLDLALQTGPFARAASGSLPLGNARYGWVASPAVARALGPDPDFARLFGQPVLTHGRDTRASVSLAAQARAQGLPTDQIAHSSSLTSALRMAVDGMGAALLPLPLCRADLAARRLVSLTVGWAPEPLDFHARYDADRAPHFIRAAADLAVSIAADE